MFPSSLFSHLNQVSKLLRYLLSESSSCSHGEGELTN